MNPNERNQDSLCTMIHEIALDFALCPPIKHLVFTVENWETHISDLEHRLQLLQQEVEYLNQEQNR